MNPDEQQSLPAHLGPLSDATAMPLESLPPLAEPSPAAAAPTPAAPVRAVAPTMAAASSESVAAPAAAGGTLDVGQLSALDTMMQAFLADGELSPSELQAYQAARAGFMGEDASHQTSPSPTGTAQADAAPAEADPAETEQPHAEDGHTTLKEAVAAYQETKLDRRYTLKPLPPAHEVHQDPQMTPSETAHSQIASPNDRPIRRITPVASVGPVDRI